VGRIGCCIFSTLPKYCGSVAWNILYVQCVVVSLQKKLLFYWLIAREAYSSFQEGRKSHSHISQFHFHPSLFLHTVNAVNYATEAFFAID
jgi:hypothetical protein